MKMLNALLCLQVLLAAAAPPFTHAFVPSSLHKPFSVVLKKADDPKRSFTTVLLKSTLSTKEDTVQQQFESDNDFHRQLKSRNNKNSKKDDDSHCLELDEVGRLRLCNSPDVLMQGLDPQTWSATRAVSGKSNSLFLHTSHPESLPEHQTSLGNLISCRRLIACARTYL